MYGETRRTSTPPTGPADQVRSCSYMLASIVEVTLSLLGNEPVLGGKPVEGKTKGRT